MVKRAERKYEKPAEELGDFKLFDFNLRKLNENLSNTEFVSVRNVEYNRTTVEVPAKSPNAADAADAPNPKTPHAVRANRMVGTSADSGIKSNQVISTTQGTNLLGKGTLNVNIPASGIKIKDERFPDGEATIRPDGVVVDKNGKEYPPGDRNNPIARNDGDKPARETPDTDPNSQHNQTKKDKDKGDLANKLMMGGMLLPALLPLALMLAAFVQGEVACDQLDGKYFQINSAVSSRKPTYPDGTPDWIVNTFSINKTKINVGFSPCVKILSTDSIKVLNSNVFDGTYDVKNVDGSCSLTIDIGKEYATANTFSNTAQFVLNTSCSDRMAYALGDDLSVVGQTGASMFSNIFGGIPWSTIFIVILFVVAISIALKALSAFRGG